MENASEQSTMVFRFCSLLGTPFQAICIEECIYLETLSNGTNVGLILLDSTLFMSFFGHSFVGRGLFFYMPLSFLF